MDKPSTAIVKRALNGIEMLAKAGFSLEKNEEKDHGKVVVFIQTRIPCHYERFLNCLC